MLNYELSLCYIVHVVLCFLIWLIMTFLLRQHAWRVCCKHIGPVIPPWNDMIMVFVTDVVGIVVVIKRTVSWLAYIGYIIWWECYPVGSTHPRVMTHGWTGCHEEDNYEAKNDDRYCDCFSYCGATHPWVADCRWESWQSKRWRSSGRLYPWSAETKSYVHKIILFHLYDALIVHTLSYELIWQARKFDLFRSRALWEVMRWHCKLIYRGLPLIEVQTFDQSSSRI